jgi:uracil-DNA glycosylase
VGGTHGGPDKDLFDPAGVALVFPSEPWVVTHGYSCWSPFGLPQVANSPAICHNYPVGSTKLEALLKDVRACTVCAEHLPFPPRPVVRAAATASLMIVGQAPGTRVQATGIPWNDPSGDRLRHWLHMSREEFYDEHRIAIIPTGFCYPGRGKGGDSPPRPECAPLWHPKLRAFLPKVRLTLLIGKYAQDYYLKDRQKKSLADTVQSYEEYLPEFFPLPHPSPRNMRWFKVHPWFDAKVVPALRKQIGLIAKS